MKKPKSNLEYLKSREKDFLSEIMVLNALKTYLELEVQRLEDVLERKVEKIKIGMDAIHYKSKTIRKK